MKFSRFCVNRPVTTTMLILMTILLGVISVVRLPIDLFPKIDIPYIMVMSRHYGAGPKEIEKLVTKPLEEAIGTMNNLKKIESTSSNGDSTIIVELNYGTNMDIAAMEMREKIDVIRSSLPKGVSKPLVLKINPNDGAIFQMGLIMNKGLEETELFAKKKLKPRLESIKGVGSVRISGGSQKQININLNKEKLVGYGISIDYVSQKLKDENINLPSGTILSGKKEVLIRTIGKFKSIDEIENLPILLPSDTFILLRDIAKVEFNNKKESSIVRANGKEWVDISIKKESGANIVAMGDRIKKEIENIRKDNPDIKLKVTYDESKIIKSLIVNVAKSALLGGVLAIVVLYIFLRNIRTTLIIGISLPLSLVAIFTLFYFGKTTINMMSLGGLAVSAGMLVDNSIVVLENIYRFRQEGYSRKEAAIKGVEEVGMSVVASTLTTVVVFIPIVFLDGMIAELFTDLALSVTFSLMASLIVALTVIPMLSSKLLKIEDESEIKNKKFKFINIIIDKFDEMYNKFSKIYETKLKWGLNHRKLIVIAGISVFILSMILVMFVGMELFPSNDDGTFSINVSLPEGTKIKETNDVVNEIESKLKDIKEINTVYSIVGGSYYGEENSNMAEILIEAIPLDERNISIKEIANEARLRLKDIPGARIRIDAQSSVEKVSGKEPLDISIYGDELKELEKISEDFTNIINHVEGVKDLKNKMEKGNPEIRVNINRDKAIKYGIDTSTIARIININLSGVVATKYKVKGNEIDIKLKGDKIFKESISNLNQLNINIKEGRSIPLESIGKIELKRGLVSINKERQLMKASLSGKIYGRDLGSVVKDIRSKLNEYPMPLGYSYKIGGQNEALEKSFKDLGMALGVAVVLVYMILASQFESLLNPFIIILSVPIAFGGGALGLFIFRQSLSVPAIMGAVILSGVVVNDAILLIDYIVVRRKMGEERNEAIIKAGPTRLRPILMTTLTTVFGLIPMLVIQKAKTLAPMAAVVIGGLALSDILILVFVPVVYTLFDDITIRMRKVFMNKVEKNI